MIILYLSNVGITNLFGGNFRNYYYIVNDQWEGGSFYKINQIVGMISIFFCCYCGWLDGKKNKISINSIIWITLNVLPRLMLSSRLFILGIGLYVLSFITSKNIKVKLRTKIIISIMFFITIIIGFNMRYDTNENSITFVILKSLDGITNLTFALDNMYSSNFNLSFFLYHWTPLPGFLFDIPNMNLSFLKHGSLSGSSEPMPLIASVVYLQGWFSLIYFFMLGSIVKSVIKSWNKKKTFLTFFIMINIIYMLLIYHNHSDWRSSSRTLILLLWFNFFLKTNGYFGVRTKIKTR